jgi:lipopolysaccharide transport system ATP-binding protein
MSVFKRSNSRMSKRPTDDSIWALRDISFEVKRGEVIGIIGRNGAGKSTLLKILSRITEPTEGTADIYGRVASLLEVGTGFHPELTGRENIFLNGAILGMRKTEIARKFDEIIAFAEVEKFIDTPVKHYSSGMYVRLAFAVAAHLEPEILLVDEVLAVGDAAFQKKCLGKIGDVTKEGRTVLFVSHNMGSIMQLCRSGILLAEGRIEITGKIAEVITNYTMENKSPHDGYANLQIRGDRSGLGDAIFNFIELRTLDRRTACFSFGEPLTIKISISIKKYIGYPRVQILMGTSDGVPIYDFMNLDSDCFGSSEIGTQEFTLKLPKLSLYPGWYIIDLWLGSQTTLRLDYIRNAIAFQVVQTPDSELNRPLDRSNGLVFQNSHWKVEQCNAVV